jgi:hypothetical protein
MGNKLDEIGGARWRKKRWVITIYFDLFAIFESDRGGHEARAFGEVEGVGQVGRKVPGIKFQWARRMGVVK